jgi:predicted transcriptional regulator
MGYRGKVVERERARQLRAEGWALLDIAEELGVAKSSVSIWVRDVDFEPRPRRRVARVREPNALQRRKQAEIEAMDAKGQERLSELGEQAFLAAGAALYAGEGAKAEGTVKFANTDPAMVAFFCRWLRTFFEVDESRMRAQVYLHEGLDLEAAQMSWSEVTCIPIAQFTMPYRAMADPSIRRAKHVHGCCYVRYSCSRTHREVMGLIRALLSSATPFPG